MAVAGGKGEAVLEVPGNVPGSAEQGEQTIVAKTETYVHGPIGNQGFVPDGRILDHHEIVVAQESK